MFILDLNRILYFNTRGENKNLTIATYSLIWHACVVYKVINFTLRKKPSIVIVVFLLFFLFDFVLFFMYSFVSYFKISNPYSGQVYAVVNTLNLCVLNVMHFKF